MYESFFDMRHTPFGKDIPVERLYESKQMQEAIGRLTYAAERNQFAVVTGDPGCGKSTLIRRLASVLPHDKYILLYLSDSQLTPRWMYAGMLNQLGLEAKFYRGDSKKLLQNEIKNIATNLNKKVVCVLDEAHLLEKETLEEFRFLLNSEFDSISPISLILVGQTELWDMRLRMQNYTAITQRIDINIVMKALDRAETGHYITAHMVYADCDKGIFTTKAEDEVYKVSGGVPRRINRVCEKTLMYAAQTQKKLIDESMVNFVTEHEMLGGVCA